MERVRTGFTTIFNELQKEYYDNDYFDKSDVKYIVKNTTKEYELYNYIGYDKNKDDYELWENYNYIIVTHYDIGRANNYVCQG